MGQEPGQVGAPVEEQKSPEELRRDIAQTREELGETAAALAEKTDVKARAREKLESVKHTVAEKKQAMNSGPGSSFAAQARTKAREKPVLTAAGAAFVGGYLVGRLRSR